MYAYMYLPGAQVYKLC